jgi:hypothetical protein
MSNVGLVYSTTEALLKGMGGIKNGRDAVLMEPLLLASFLAVTTTTDLLLGTVPLLTVAATLPLLALCLAASYKLPMLCSAPLLAVATTGGERHARSATLAVSPLSDPFLAVTASCV